MEPIAAGDAIAGPIVEIFVGDDGLHMGEVRIRRRIGRRQHISVVEDVEALVLHRPILKSETATIMKTSRSYSRPKTSSSQRMARLRLSIA